MFFNCYNDFRQVTKQELIPLTAPVIPMESCIEPFLDGCDKDNDQMITIKEWGMCLGLKRGELLIGQGI